jgi:hypothetical protein
MHEALRRKGDRNHSARSIPTKTWSKAGERRPRESAFRGLRCPLFETPPCARVEFVQQPGAGGERTPNRRSTTLRTMRTVQATRYVLPLREGSSVPALVEGDDLGLYVVKLRGSGQGPKALIAELVAGELARALGLEVPDLVFIQLDERLAASEPDPELCRPLESSAGLNLGMDYLPGSITFDPVVGPIPSATVASRIVLFDAFVMNVDRTARNPNILSWHGRPWLIDHGASLYLHHAWRSETRLESCQDPFVEVRDHVLLPWASELGDASAHVRAHLTSDVIDRIAGQIPASWLAAETDRAQMPPLAHDYAEWLHARAAALGIFLHEAERVRAQHV